jgi:hypothetical protein|tara:strand:+ start:284 stop:742 length:459 start_codon:yes stop_codon:yes gene_type:complete
MSFIGKLFGSDQALGKIVDTAKDLVDESFYTDQEEAEDKAKAGEAARGMVIDWVAASTGSRLARRLIAFSITGTWLAMYWLSTTLSIAAVWAEDELSLSQLQQSSVIADAAGQQMVSAVMLILGFYFAAPYMGDIASVALKKFGNDNNKNPK